MTASELDAIERLVKAATSQGPWHAGTGGGVYDASGMTVASEVDDNDAYYIAAMHPQTALALVAEVRRLHAVLADELSRLGQEQSAPRQIVTTDAAPSVQTGTVGEWAAFVDGAIVKASKTGGA